MTRQARPRPQCSREIEIPLAQRFGLVAGVDEVGRGAIAGPVCVGVCVVGPGTGAPPEGLTDSKLLTAKRRQALVQPAANWALASAVGMASAAEIDQIGIVAALRLAGRRALFSVREQGYGPRFVLLDGSHDWISEPEVDLFSCEDGAPPSGTGNADAMAGAVAAGAEEGMYGPGSGVYAYDGPVQTVVKGDALASVIAAASVLAKVRRDFYMAGLLDPGYGWASNKGYGSVAHYQGIRKHGLSEQHRRSWNLTGAA